MLVKKLLFLFLIFVVHLLGMQSSIILASEGNPVFVNSIKQEIIRPSYPFPSLLSTGPYVWYDDTDNQPTKGHAYRISTFSEGENTSVFIEKINFGFDGCCLEIVEFRQLILDEDFLGRHFPANKGSYGFKLLRWIDPDIFEFNAYGGNYLLSQIGSKSPVLEEINPK